MRKLKLILHPKQIEGRSRRDTQLDFDIPNNETKPSKYRSSNIDSKYMPGKLF